MKSNAKTIIVECVLAVLIGVAVAIACAVGLIKEPTLISCVLHGLTIRAFVALFEFVWRSVKPKPYIIEVSFDDNDLKKTAHVSVNAMYKSRAEEKAKKLASSSSRYNMGTIYRIVP